MNNDNSHFGKPLPKPVSPDINLTSDPTDTSKTGAPPVLHLKHDFLIKTDVYKLILNTVEQVRNLEAPKVIIFSPGERRVRGCDSEYAQSLFDDLGEVFKGMGDDVAFTCVLARSPQDDNGLPQIIIGVYNVDRMINVPLNRLVENQSTYCAPIHPSKLDELSDMMSFIIKRDKHNFVGTVACLVYDHSIKPGLMPTGSIEAEEIRARGLVQLGTAAFTPFVYVNLLLNKDCIAVDTKGLVK